MFSSAFPEFVDRSDAGNRLLQALPDLDPENTIVVALPRGGVPVAAEICKARGLPLDLAFVKKIGTPGQPELALGAIVDGADPQVFVNRDVAESLGMSTAEVERLGRQELGEIARRKAVYLRGGRSRPVRGKTVVLVDDGVATGATVRAVIRAMRRQGVGRLILALPVAPAASLRTLRKDVDDVVCLATPKPFYGVGTHYRKFPQVNDRTVVECMRLYGGFSEDAVPNGQKHDGQIPS